MTWKAGTLHVTCPRCASPVETSAFAQSVEVRDYSHPQDKVQLVIRMVDTQEEHVCKVLP